MPYLDHLPPLLQPLLPESLARSLLPGSEYQRQLLAAQVQLRGSTAELQADLLQSQARLAELEAQVKDGGAPGCGGQGYATWRVAQGAHLPTLPPSPGAEAGAGAGPAAAVAGEPAAAAPGRPGAHRECSQVPTAPPARASPASGPALADVPGAALRLSALTL